jgi:hypothetical protein
MFFTIGMPVAVHNSFSLVSCRPLTSLTVSIAKHLVRIWLTFCTSVPHLYSGVSSFPIRCRRYWLLTIWPVLNLAMIAMYFQSVGSNRTVTAQVSVGPRYYNPRSTYIFLVNFRSQKLRETYGQDRVCLLLLVQSSLSVNNSVCQYPCTRGQ